MSNLFRFPVRVYILFGLLGFFGILAGRSLSVSLFPLSSRPSIYVNISYHNLTSDDFIRSYGHDLENRLKAINFEGHEVEKVTARYERSNVRYVVHFNWGTPARAAKKETESVAQNFAAVFPQEIRDSLGVHEDDEETGFFALMYYSDSRSLEDLYNYLEPILAPRVATVADAQGVAIWNPSSKEIQVTLNPERMAELGLLPRTLVDRISNTFHNESGGYVEVGSKKLEVIMKRQVEKTSDLENILIPTANGGSVLLKEIATVSVAEPKDRQNIIRTNGVKSLMLYAKPRPGGNIKKMSEDILKIVNEVQPSLTADVQARPLVDPSVFIKSAVENVFLEVGVAACLAVLILFAFIGNIKNVATAALEIPLSIVLSFIFMKWVGINLNLISLAGLALSAGMNVDGSVVVMENIFRHFEKRKNEILGWNERVQIVVDAVNEVRIPLIATTVASLVVFLPLGFTSALTNALLGDLAWAVVFSHGISAFVALILVPTIRLHILRKGMPLEKPAPLEPVLHWIENFYSRALRRFLTSPRMQFSMIAGSIIALVIAITLILPKLPQEIIGKPDTDWLSLYINAPNLVNIKQMDGVLAENEAKINEIFGPRVLSTFSQAWSSTGGSVMWRLKDKHQMDSMMEEAEKTFISSPDVHFYVSSYNPSELPIPNPPDLRVEVKGNDANQIQIAAESIWDLLMQGDSYTNLGGPFSPGRQESILLEPNWEQISLLQSKGSAIKSWDIAEISRLATSGAKLGDIRNRTSLIPVWLRYPEERVHSLSDLESLPIGLQGRILPLKALARPVLKISDPSTYRENGRELGLIEARLRHEDKSKAVEIFQKTSVVLEKWKTDHAKDGVTIQYDNGQEELVDALNQLKWAVALSILLIFVTMVLQFGSLASAALILVPIPLGFIGVVFSLWIFHSTLSLNSALGTILLNGIVVGNSILLVDFFRREIARGLSPLEAALSSSRIRLRPILMTSLTTGLGMLPIAIGIGEGGKILQPLGLAVVGGLACSFLLTLFLVPLLQNWYWSWKLSGPSQTAPSSSQTLTSGSTSGIRDTVLSLVFIFIFSGFSEPAHAVVAPAKVFGGSSVTGPFHAWVHDHTLQYPLVRQKKEISDGFKSRKLASRLRLLPKINLSAERDYFLLPTSSAPAQNYAGTADLNLFKFGGDKAVIDRADAADAYNQAIIEQAKQTAETDLAEIYFLDLDTRLRRKVLEEMTAEDVQLQKIGAERFQRGLLPLEEREKLEIDVLNRHFQIEELDQNIREIELRRGNFGITESLAGWPWLNSEFEKQMTLISLREFNFSAHPDWQVDDYAWQRAEADKAQAWSALYPSIDLHSIYSTGNTLVTSYDPTLNNSWYNGIVLTIPLFSGYETYAGYKEAVASRTVAEISRGNTRARLTSQWSARLAQFRQWTESLKLRTRGVEAAERISQSSLRRFRAGHESVNDLALDQGRTRTAQLNLIDAQIEYHRTALKLIQASGEVWSD